MYKAIINSVKKAWRGEEKLWKVFWLWFVILYPISLIVGLSWPFFANDMVDYAIVNKIVSGILSVCGFVMIFIYPIILIRSLWKCSNNVTDKFYIFSLLSKGLPIPFLWMHFYYSATVFVGSCLFINNAFAPWVKICKIF